MNSQTQLVHTELNRVYFYLFFYTTGERIRKLVRFEQAVGHLVKQRWVEPVMLLDVLHSSRAGDPSLCLSDRGAGLGLATRLGDGRPRNLVLPLSNSS